MKSDNRFDQCKAETGSGGTAGWIGPIKTVEYPWEMLRCNSGTVVADRNLRAISKIADRDANLSVIGCEAQCIVDQVSNRAIEKDWIRKNFGVA